MQMHSRGFHNITDEPKKVQFLHNTQDDSCIILILLAAMLVPHPNSS
jgi:hypothetical protein